MNYKDKSFEIDDNQIKFKNTTLIPFIIICVVTTPMFFILSKGNLLSISASVIGVIIGFQILKLFVSPYLKNTIDLSKVDYINPQVWNKSIDQNRDFWGTGKYKYHFPTGQLNKKSNPKVIFVHIKDRKSAVGFVPENFDNLISVLRSKGIEIRLDHEYVPNDKM